MDQQDVMPSTLQQPAAAAPAYDSSGYGAGPKPMQKMVDNPNMAAPAYKKGGKIAKKAVGGTMGVSAASVRGNSSRPQAPVKPMSERRLAQYELKLAQQLKKDLAAKESVYKRDAARAAAQMKPTGSPAPMLTKESARDAMSRSLGVMSTTAPNATPGMKKGGSAMTKPVKRAVGGAGKTRKGMC
jgi:hypothetical protein